MSGRRQFTRPARVVSHGSLAKDIDSTGTSHHVLFREYGAKPTFARLTNRSISSANHETVVAGRYSTTVGT